MGNVKKGLLTKTEWRKHLRKWGKKLFWGAERSAEKREITKQLKDADYK